MNRIFATLSLSCAILLVALRPVSATPITMAWSPVGNPGNAADPATGSLSGAVNYSYNIGTYDVTNSQYVAFLNSNDPTGADPLAIYNSNMSNATYGGINFNSGAPAGQMYSAITANENNPVNYVTWYDAIRFANWMDNGQPVYAIEPTALSNATENGAYTLDGFIPTPSNGLSVTRNAGATVFLPSENEWYKAAYYNPANSTYYLYPTSSNSAPNGSGPTSTPNSANSPPGDPNNLTAVGAYSETTSPYGAYDMGGDVSQWNEALISSDFRGLRGGSFNSNSSYLLSSLQESEFPTVDLADVGFRVASVPEPSSAVLVVIACGMTMWWRKRK